MTKHRISDGEFIKIIERICISAWDNLGHSFDFLEGQTIRRAAQFVIFFHGRPKCVLGALEPL